MNQNVASYPSVLGVPDCIEERVSFDASLAQVVGTSARWSSFESRYQSGIVTGSAFLTPELRAWRESHESTFISLALGRAFRCTLTQWEPRADSQGRAIVSYAALLVEIYYLPRPDALVCLYVPRWQEEQSNVLYDLSGNGNDYSGAMTWHTDGIEQSGRWAATALHNAFTSDNITTILDRDINPDAPQGPGVSGAFGLGLIYSGSSTTYIHEAYYNYEKYTRAGMTDIRLNTAFDDDGWSVMRQTGTAAEYNGTTYNVASNRRVTHIRYNRVAVAMYRRLRVIAVWSVSLTDEEIVAAQRYLSQPTRPS